MKNCKLCKSLHEESGDICRVCIVDRVTWKDEETFKKVLDGHKVVSSAYKNMARGKNVHPCPYCQRLTPDEKGTLCVVCTYKNITQYEIDKPISQNKEDIKMIKNNPKRVDWEGLIWYGIVVTGLTSIISLILYNIPFSWLFQLFLSILFSPEVFSYYFRVPIFMPLMFLSIGLGLHLFFKFYYGGFFSPIRRWFNNLKIGLENLKLSAKIRWNAYLSRKRTIQAYKNQKVQEYQLLKDRTKLEDDSYEITKQYLRQNRTEPNLEQANHQQ